MNRTQSVPKGCVAEPFNQLLCYTRAEDKFTFVESTESEVCRIHPLYADWFSRPRSISVSGVPVVPVETLVELRNLDLCLNLHSDQRDICTKACFDERYPIFVFSMSVYGARNTNSYFRAERTKEQDANLGSFCPTVAR
ncbi:hypothetical protein SCHPADRAFT_711611 [Schizopora paradoxa]|uniref:Uncharacterized protein n=1 Tax=Schizopora paradoxa TaxID=27342 RepID=A0A0H2R376_9AGAM|nr:hypothetical protein SCHPADRAFT_711611 [Schizopora paradoxa]